MLLVKSEPIKFEYKMDALNSRMFEGYASTFGNKDLHGEVIDRGAFKKTITERMEKGLIKVLWQHRDPLGMPVELHEDKHGLYVKAEISATSLGNDALTLMRDGVVDHMSIGFMPIKTKNDDEDDGTLHHTEIKLYEVSPVTFPANEEAVITSVKQMEWLDDFARKMDELENRMSHWQGVTLPSVITTSGLTSGNTTYTPSHWSYGAPLTVDPSVTVADLAPDHKCSEYCAACLNVDDTEMAGHEGEPGDMAEDAAEESADDTVLEEKAAIGSHSTATNTGTWDGSANEGRLKQGAPGAYAWRKAGADAAAKSTYKFIHHFVNANGSVGAASTVACSAGIAVLNGGRGGTVIPSADKTGVWSHLAKHLRDAGKFAPPLRNEEWLAAIREKDMSKLEEFELKQDIREKLAVLQLLSSGEVDEKAIDDALSAMVEALLRTPQPTDDQSIPADDSPVTVENSEEPELDLDSDPDYQSLIKEMLAFGETLKSAKAE